jgi:hypothetical protein
VDWIRLSTRGGTTRKQKALVRANAGGESLIDNTVIEEGVVVMYTYRISAVVVFNALYGNTLGKIGFEAANAYLYQSL